MLTQGSHRLEKSLKMKEQLEKSLKKCQNLKSTGNHIGFLKSIWFSTFLLLFNDWVPPEILEKYKEKKKNDYFPALSTADSSAKALFPISGFVKVWSLLVRVIFYDRVRQVPLVDWISENTGLLLLL